MSEDYKVNYRHYEDSEYQPDISMMMNIDGNRFGIYECKHKLSNGQTIVMAFEESYRTLDTRYWNIVLYLYTKRGTTPADMSGAKLTGIDPRESFIAVRNMFPKLLEELTGKYKSKDNFIYCTWVDNKRRDVYHRFLKRYGFDYGTFGNKKVIYRFFENGAVVPQKGE